MKTRKLSFLLCLVMILSTMAPMALAASPELDVPIDDPLDPEPYTYINYITIDLDINNAGKSTNYCHVYIPNSSCTCTITGELQRKVPGASWNTATTVKTWTVSGSSNIELDKDWYVLSGYVYRFVADVMVYTANGYVGDATTVFSNTVSY